MIVQATQINEVVDSIIVGVQKNFAPPNQKEELAKLAELFSDMGMAVEMHHDTGANKHSNRLRYISEKLREAALEAIEENARVRLVWDDTLLHCRQAVHLNYRYVITHKPWLNAWNATMYAPNGLNVVGDFGDIDVAKFACEEHATQIVEPSNPE